MFKKFFKEVDIKYFFSTREDGDMVGSMNRERFFKKHGISLNKVVVARLDHGVGVMEIKSTLKPEIADALVTKTPGVCLALTAGDCVPIIFWDKEQKILAVSHNGWRGTLAGLTSKVLSRMRDYYGSQSQNILIGIGPSICQMHYEVRGDVFTKIPNKFKRFALAGSGNHWLLDLRGYNKQQMLDEGIPQKNIEDCKICTFEDPNYFSSRNGDASRFILGGMIVPENYRFSTKG